MAIRILKSRLKIRCRYFNSVTGSSMVSPFDSDDMSTNIFDHRSTLKIYTKTSLNVVKKQANLDKIMNNLIKGFHTTSGNDRKRNTFYWNIVYLFWSLLCKILLVFTNSSTRRENGNLRANSKQSILD